MISLVLTRRASPTDDYAAKGKGRIAPAFSLRGPLPEGAALQRAGRSDAFSLSCVTAPQYAGLSALIAPQ
jgi:hypothetical protein